MSIEGQKSQKKSDVYEKIYIWNTNGCTYENGECLKGDSVITCDEIIKVTKAVRAKTIPTIFNKNRYTVKQNILKFY